MSANGAVKVDLFEIGIMPVFRLQSDRASEQITPFVEAGVGGHLLLTQTHLGETACLRRVSVEQILRNVLINAV